MRATKLNILFCLAITCLALPYCAEAEAKPFLYHWITPDKIILWQSSADDKPVTADFNQATQKWDVTPSNFPETWRPILDEVIQLCVPNADLQTLKDDLRWSFVLTRLRNNHGNVIWALERKPSVEVYLLSKGERMVEVAFIHEANGEASPAVVPFTKRSDGKWIKDRELNLGPLFGLTTKSDELHKVLAIPASESLQISQKWWEDVWDKWIKTIFNDKEPINHIMYKDTNGELRWLLRARLGQGATLPTKFRQMPTALPVIAEPGIEKKRASEPAPSTFPWPLIAVISLAFNAFILLFLLFGHHLPPAPSWLPQRLAKFLERANLSKKPQADFFPKEGFERLLKRARECYLEKFNEDTGIRRMLLAALDCTRDMYLELAKSNELQQEAISYREKVVEEFLQHSLGVEASSAERVKNWIELGRVAETATSQLNGLKIPEEVENRVKQQVTIWPLQSPADWLAHWPNLLAAYDECLGMRENRCGELAQELEVQNKRHEEAIGKSEGDCINNIASLKTEIEALKQTNEQRSRDLESARERVANLETEIGRVQSGSSAMQEKNQSAQAALTDLQSKIDDIRKVLSISRTLRWWLQQFFDVRMRHYNEVRPVALLTSLINFSLCQLCFSIIEDQQSLRRVIAHNIYLVSQVLEKSGDDRLVAAAAGMREQLNCLAPQVEMAVIELKDARGGSETDSMLFREFLRQLKTDTEINLAPFFIGMDKQNLVSVNAS